MGYDRLFLQMKINPLPGASVKTKTAHEPPAAQLLNRSEQRAAAQGCLEKGRAAFSGFGEL